MILFHFTCEDHGRPGIDRSGLLKPNPHPLLPKLGPVVWLTDLDAVTRPEHLGLPSRFLDCDRTAVRYLVNTEEAVWWPFVRSQAQPLVRSDLERYGRWTHWWISRVPLEVSL